MPANENLNEFCFAWIPALKEGEGKKRAALVKGYRWTPGETIKVAFLDGDPAVQKRVREAAAGWTAPGLANLQIAFVSGGKADVRISFRYAGSWSLIGNNCRSFKDGPTMNYGWLTRDSTADEVQRVVLHEFGHALGLIHEHQNPAGGIKWNKAQVIKDLSGPPNSWDEATIEHNMFEPYAAAETNFTRTDKDSIMMYPIRKSWTLNGYSVGLNSKLSKTDRQFIHQQYP